MTEPPCTLRRQRDLAAALRRLGHPGAAAQLEDAYTCQDPEEAPEGRYGLAYMPFTGETRCVLRGETPESEPTLWGDVREALAWWWERREAVYVTGCVLCAAALLLEVGRWLR